MSAQKGACDVVLIEKRRWIIFSSVFVVVLLHLSLLLTTGSFRSQKPDFAALYEAGRASLHHHSIGAAANGYTAIADTMHPPYEMIIFAPLALLNYTEAYLVWWGCNVLLLLSVTFLLWKHVPQIHAWYHYLIILAATFFPALVAVIQGQDSILLLFVLTLFFVRSIERREFWAGFVLAMGMFKFVLVLPIALSLVIERRWRAMIGFFAGFTALVFAGIAIDGVDGCMAYLRVLAGYSKSAPEKAGTESIMPNLRGFVHVIGSGFAPERWLMVVTIVISLALFILVNWWFLRRGNTALRVASQVVLAMIISYHLYPHDASILILPLLLLLYWCICWGVRASLTVVVMCIAVLAYVCPLALPLNWSMPLVFCASVGLLGCLSVAIRNSESHWQTVVHPVSR